MATTDPTPASRSRRDPRLRADAAAACRRRCRLDAADRLGDSGIQHAVIWAALIPAFIGGVRRGFGFARADASNAVEIAAAVAYFTIAGLALVTTSAVIALALLAAGFALAALIDTRAGRRSDAPAYFALLRPPQLLFGIAGVTSCWVWLVR